MCHSDILYLSNLTDVYLCIQVFILSSHHDYIFLMPYSLAYLKIPASRLQQVQSYAERLVTRTRRHKHITPSRYDNTLAASLIVTQIILCTYKALNTFYQSLHAEQLQKH